MKILMMLLAIGLSTADKLDRTYLPPSGSRYSGGQSGDLQVPLEYTNGFSTTGRPQGTLSPIFSSSTPRPVSPSYQTSFPSSTLASQNLNTFTSGIPTTTTSYAFTQTTTYSPVDDQTLVDRNGNPVQTNLFQPGAPQKGGILTGSLNQRPGFGYQSSTVRYDENGNIVPQVVYDRNGNIVPQNVYDKNGNIVPQVVYDRNGNIVPQNVYDKNGNIVPQVVYDVNGNIVPHKVYDKNGNIVPQVVYDRNGNILPQNDYDKNGNIVPQVVFDVNGNIVSHKVYDKNGNIVPQIAFDRNRNIVPHTVYDKHGNIVPQIAYDRNGDVVPQTVYDKNENVLSQIAYDNYGNIIPKTVYDKNSNTNIPQVVLDKEGNVKQGQLINGTLSPHTVYDINGKIISQYTDRNGNVVPQVNDDRNGNIMTKISYDKNGNVLPKVVYDKDGNIVPQTVYDQNGNIIPQVTYDSNGNVVPKDLYDKNGNIMPQTTYGQNGNVVPQVTYDTNGNVIPKIIYDKNGNIVPQTVYDQNGNVVPQTVYDTKGNIGPQVIYDQYGKIVPQTTYDKNGNVILQPSKYGVKTPYIRPQRPQVDSDRNAVILNYQNVLTPEGFAYSFDTSNGIHADESGTAVNGIKAQGAYSYIGDDGKTYSIVYTADENGFLPRGDHLPTPPPIPEAILRVIEDAKKAKEAGIIQDGSYDDKKYGYKKYQGSIDYHRPSNRKKIIGPDGKPVRRPITYTNDNDHEDRVDYIEEDVNEGEDVLSGNKKPSRLPNRRPSKNGQTFDSNDYSNNDNINDDGVLTVGNEPVPRPQKPTQNPEQDYQIIKNPDGSKNLVPVRKNNQPGTPKPNQFINTNEPFYNTGLKKPGNRRPQIEDQKYTGNRRPQLPNEDSSNFFTVKDGQGFRVDDVIKDGKRPTSTYQGYEYLAPVKTFGLGKNDKSGNNNTPQAGSTSTAKPFVTQPEDTDSYIQRNGDRRIPSKPSNQISIGPDKMSSKFPNEYEIQSTTRPIDSNTQDYNKQSQTSTLSPEYITTYRPINSSEPSFGDKKIPVTIGGGISSTPAFSTPSTQSVYSTTTYRPNYNINKGKQGENILVDEFGRPAIQSTSSPFTPGHTNNPTYSVTQRVPSTIDTSGRPVQTQSILEPGSTVAQGQTFTPQKVDRYGRPIEETLVDGNGRPIITGLKQADQITGRPAYSINPDNQITRISSPAYNVDVYGRPVISGPGQSIGNLPEISIPGHQQHHVTMNEYGRPVVTGDLLEDSGRGTTIFGHGQSPSTQVYGNRPNQGEDFSGPTQQQKYDPKTGYYY